MGSISWPIKFDGLKADHWHDVFSFGKMVTKNNCKAQKI